MIKNKLLFQINSTINNSDIDNIKYTTKIVEDEQISQLISFDYKSILDSPAKNSSISTLEELIYISKITHNRTDKDIEFVVAHYAAKGCIYENNTMAPKGWVFDYKPETIKQWFLGDIHMRQNVAPNAAYPGSPCQLNFGESGQKGIDIYDVDKGKRERILLSAAPPLMTVSVKDRVPKFLDNALYRVYASKKFIDYSFPPNVVSVQLFEAKKDDKKTKKVERENIDFGNPLDGLEEVLTRYELGKPLIVKAMEEARAIVT